MLKAKLSQTNNSLLSTNHKNTSARLIIPALLVGALLTGCAGGPTLKANGAVDVEPEQEEMMDTVSESAEAEAEETAEAMSDNDAVAAVEEEPMVETTGSEQTTEITSEDIDPVTESAANQMTSTAEPVVAASQKPAEVAVAATSAAASKQKPATPAIATPQIPAVVAVEPVKEEPVAAPVEVESTVSSTIGTRFGIWTLARGENGRCMLTTPTFQVKDGDFTSQFWMDIEQSRFIVNASLTLKSDNQRSGIKFDGGSLITFDEQEMPTRMVINQDVTKSIANGSKLFVYLKSEELGETILTKEISLKNTSAAVASLKSCK